MQTEARGKILLRVSGILLIIYAALLIVLGLIVMVGGSYILGAGSDLFSEYYYYGAYSYAGGMMAMIGIVVILIAAFYLICGIIGVKNAAYPEKSTSCLVLGIIMVAFQVIGLFSSLSNDVGASIIWAILLLAVMVLYMVGAILNKQSRAAAFAPPYSPYQQNSQPTYPVYPQNGQAPYQPVSYTHLDVYKRQVPPTPRAMVFPKFGLYCIIFTFRP